jgi:hypothetical protein
MTEQDRVLQAIEAGHKNAPAIVKATGMTPAQVKDAIPRLRTLGLIEPIPNGGNALYRPARRCLLAGCVEGRCRVIINAADLVLNPGKPPRPMPLPEQSDPVVIHYINASAECDIEIPRAKLPAEGFASFLWHGATVRRGR